MADRAGRWSPKSSMYTSFILRVVAPEVAEEDRGLGDVVERGSLAGEEIRQVGDGLAQLAVETAGHELAVADADLAGDDSHSPARTIGV